MTVFVAQDEAQAVEIPAWVRDLSSFRRWATSVDYPQRGQFAWLGGHLWADPSMERERHNQAKTEITSVLNVLSKQLAIGRFYSDGMGVSNKSADLATEPDGMFVSFASLKAKRVRFARREDSLYALGSPDMVLEIVSSSSVQKDTILLRDLYWRAGAREYWLVDPRGTELLFDILRHRPKGFVAARKQGGWVKSDVFGKSFRLIRGTDESELETYTLAVR